MFYLNMVRHMKPHKVLHRFIQMNPVYLPLNHPSTITLVKLHSWAKVHFNSVMQQYDTHLYKKIISMLI